MLQQPLVKILLQITLIGVVWGSADILKKLFNIPMSSGIVGLFLMLGLLLTGVIKLAWVNVGAKFILGELVLLFIPLMMSITQYQQLFFAKGWQLMITIVVSTALVMLSVALGNASHGFGTARASQRHESEGVIASLTMVLAGLFMVFFGPALIHLMTAI